MVQCGTRRTGFLGPSVYSEAPDGGWGWMVAAAFFFVEVFTYGTIKTFGIFLQDLMTEFGETNNRVSWIVSISVFVMAFNAPLSAVMTNLFGFQLVVMTGGLLISVGTIATSFSSSINQMYITYGLVAGLGYCLTFLPTVTILSKYFTRRRALVVSLASIGESIAIFTFAPAFSALRNRIGWRHTMAVIGVLQSTIIICGALLRPIVIKPTEIHKTETDRSCPMQLEALSIQQDVDGTNSNDSLTSTGNTSCGQKSSHGIDAELTGDSVKTGDSGIQFIKDTDVPETMIFLDKSGIEQTSVENSMKETGETEEKDAGTQMMKDEDIKSRDTSLSAKILTLLDFSIFREQSFILYSLFGLFVTFGFFAPQFYIIEMSVSRGVERDHATYMLSIMAGAEIFGRFIIGWILSHKRLIKKKLLVLLACDIAMTLDLLGFTLVTEFYGLAVFCALYGIFMGTLAPTHIPMLAEEDVVGIEKMSSAAGVYVFIQSFSSLAGPPLGGVLIDLTQNYGSAFYSCAAGMGLSAVFLGLVRPAKRGLLCRRKRPQNRKERKEVCEKQCSV
ncbi:monocarboxylate transporter 7-like [Brachionichthys hirsutus]|uniref:monocarboxylate transporter 7-like n=1 Tax=Brachionichthys hirsutus TaxID=412623 RepID=UPI0036053CBC